MALSLYQIHPQQRDLEKAAVINKGLKSMFWISPFMHSSFGQVEPQATEKMTGMLAYADGSTWNPNSEGAGYYYYNGSSWVKLVSESAKYKITPEGGYAVKLTNKTGGASVKGEVVTAGAAVNNSVTKIVVDVPNPIGVFYESGVADAAEAWVVVSGIADVYFVGNTTRGMIARGFMTADGASYVTGQAIAEAVPTSPFSVDKHFYEIGHILESRTGAGLAKVVLHFN